MTNTHHPHDRAAHAAPLSRRGFTITLASSWLVSACGGGGDLGIAGISSGGTGSFSSGTIRGFGSIIVNGVRYDDSRAVVRADDGAGLSNGLLRLGMVVEVNGGAISTDAAGLMTAAANSIGVRSELKGPVTAINATAATLTVLSQQVRVRPGTVFDEGLVGGLSAIRGGDVLEIYGLLVSPGVYDATRIERVASVSLSHKLRGPVANVNTTNRTFTIGSAVINYAAASAPGSLANGQFVRVDLSPLPNVASQLVATAITSSATLNAVQASSAETEIEGYVTAYTSSTSFSVNGVPVDARSAAKVPSSGLVLGAEVEVKGLVRDGVLIAREVELEDDTNTQTFEVKGALSSLNTTAKTFVVRGVTVNYSSATFTKGNASQLANGQTVEAKGALGNDQVTLVANEVEIDN